MPVEPRWLDLDFLIYANQEQIELYGGEHGILNEGLIDSALNIPRNLFEIEGEEDLLFMAVRLGVGIARNHGFLDGNKRTGVIAMITFLIINGHDLKMRNDRTLGKLIELALDKKLSEADITAMLYTRVVERVAE